jgi:hypothetical protein
VYLEKCRTTHGNPLSPRFALGNIFLIGGVMIKRSLSFSEASRSFNGFARGEGLRPFWIRRAEVPWKRAEGTTKRKEKPVLKVSTCLPSHHMQLVALHQRSITLAGINIADPSQSRPLNWSVVASVACRKGEIPSKMFHYARKIQLFSLFSLLSVMN